jgi:hypothetical protein
VGHPGLTGLRGFAALALLAAIPALAQYEPPNAPKTDDAKAFYSAVARSIFALVPAEREKFGLTLDERRPPSFYGRAPNTLEALPCERIAAFGMLGFATELGHLSAAVCANGARARELSLRSKSRFGEMMKQFGTDEAQLRKAGWYYAEENLADDAEYYYFPVLLISHGVLGPVTGVLYEKKRGKALVVQAEVRRMCGEGFARDFKDAPFCRDLGEAVKRIVLDLRGLL